MEHGHYKFDATESGDFGASKPPVWVKTPYLQSR